MWVQLIILSQPVVTWEVIFELLNSIVLSINSVLIILGVGIIYLRVFTATWL